MERLLVGLGSNGVGVLAILLAQQQVNEGLVDRIIKANINTQNV